MLTWKKPIAIVFASAGVFVSSAIPQLTLGQTNVQSRNAQVETGTLVRDSIPFSTPYDLESASTTPLTQPAPTPNSNSDSTVGQQITSLPATNAANHAETYTVQDAPSNQTDFKPTGFAAPTPQVSMSGLPTVIIRPPANASSSINDLIVNVEKIPGSGNRDYAVRLMVPDSVKIIEVTPVHDPGSPRNFKIQLEQHSNQRTDQPTNGSIASTYSMPIAAPVHSASSLNAVRPRTQPRPLMPMLQPESIPVKQQSPARNGFQRNPYFQPKDTSQDFQPQPIARAPRNIGPPEVIEAFEPPIVASGDYLRSNQASFTESAAASPSSPHVDGTADRLSCVDSLETDSPIHFAVFGPNKMGLGDTGDFTIYVNNPTGSTINDVAVQLDVPSGFDVVLLDRAAEFSEKTGTLTWQIAEVLHEQELFIRYRVKSLTEGTQLQQVSVGSEENPGQANEFETFVKVETESSEAPVPPFESN